MGVFVFDEGYLFGVMPGSNPTPVKFGSLQRISVPIIATLTDMPLQTQFTNGKAVKGVKIECTAEMAQINAALFSLLMFGQSPAAGSQALANDVAATIPSNSPFIYTAVPPSGGTWLQDLGVQYDASGLPLTNVASNPGQGQYSVSAGVYTFNTLDQGQNIVLNYLYMLTTGFNLALANAYRQIASSFQAVLTTQYNGKQLTWNLAKCVSTRFLLPTGIGIFSVPQFQFSAIADLSGGLGQVGVFSFSE